MAIWSQNSRRTSLGEEGILFGSGLGMQDTDVFIRCVIVTEVSAGLSWPLCAPASPGTRMVPAVPVARLVSCLAGHVGSEQLCTSGPSSWARSSVNNSPFM